MKNVPQDIGFAAGFGRSLPQIDAMTHQFHPQIARFL
jgi:hypothetical protein